MKINLSFIPIILLFATLTACGGASSTPTSESESPATIGEEAPVPSTEASAPTETGQESNTSNFEPISGGAPMEGCTIATLLPQADPTVVSLFPPVNENDWISGPDDAAVTIVEYGDFQ